MNSETMSSSKVDRIVDTAVETIKKHMVDTPRFSEVVAYQLLRAMPNHPQGLHLMGLVKQRLRKFEESIDFIDQAISVDPDNADNYNNLALNYTNLGDFDKSIYYIGEALKRKESHLFYNNLALQYRQKQDHQNSIKYLEKALEIQPLDPEVWNNLGGVYGELKDIKKSEECFLRAAEISPYFPAAHVDLAFTYHLLGDWNRGFTEYEWRFDHFSQLDYYKKAYDMNKKWCGEPLDGKTILLYGEQGFGDVIQFSRYVKFLAEADRRIVHVQKGLETLVSRIEGVDETIVRDIVSNSEVDFPEYDYQCSLMSLPYVLQNFKVTGEPYVKPLMTLDSKNIYPDTFNIGIVWAGSPMHPNDAIRSMPLEAFRPLHDTEGVRLFNLQLNCGKRVYPFGNKVVDLAEGCEDMNIIDMTNMIENFDDTAAIVSGLDLVVTVDTALVHLCGALGVPCWTLVTYNSDWRWKLEGDTTEWYDSVRLYRQEVRDDWSHPMQRVVQDVKKLIAP